VKPSPAELHKQTGGGDAYRVAMLNHGHVYPTAPWTHKTSDKRVIQCGLTHEQNWSEWQEFRDDDRVYEGRWCRTCATTQARRLAAEEEA
jgi:hypothetical protein